MKFNSDIAPGSLNKTGNDGRRGCGWNVFLLRRNNLKHCYVPPLIATRLVNQIKIYIIQLLEDIDTPQFNLKAVWRIDRAPFCAAFF